MRARSDASPGFMRLPRQAEGKVGSVVACLLHSNQLVTNWSQVMHQDALSMHCVMRCAMLRYATLRYTMQRFAMMLPYPALPARYA